MNLDKLPARYSKMSDDPNIIGSDEAAVKLARAGASRGGRPGALHVDSQKELDKATVRPGFLRWNRDDPRLDLKVVQQGAKALKTNDLMASLANKHSQKIKGSGQTPEFTMSGLGDEVVTETTEVVASTGGMDMKKILCCLGCAAVGGGIVFAMFKKGILKV